MKGIVWGNRWISAVNKLDQIALKYEYLHISPIQIIKTKNEYTITYEKGDNWRAIRGNTKSRGYKCNISYIPYQVPSSVIRDIIYPTTTAFPYSAYHYYGEPLL